MPLWSPDTATRRVYDRGAVCFARHFRFTQNVARVVNVVAFDGGFAAIDDFDTAVAGRINRVTRDFNRRIIRIAKEREQIDDKAVHVFNVDTVIADIVDRVVCDFDRSAVADIDTIVADVPDVVAFTSRLPKPSA